MATLLGTDTYQKQASTNPGARPPGSIVSGNVVEFFGTYTCTGSEVTADVVPLIKLPIGAILRSLYVSTDAIGGTTAIFSEIGDAGDPDRYATTDIPLTAAQTETAMTLKNDIAITPYAIATAANQTVTATMTHAGAPTAGKKIVIRGFYRMP